jgi:hypothetical protein
LKRVDELDPYKEEAVKRDKAREWLRQLK